MQSTTNVESSPSLRIAIPQGMAFPRPETVARPAAGQRARETVRSEQARARREVPEETVSTESIGSYLKRHREKRGMSVAEVSRVTRVPVVSLAAIESDHFDDLPGEVFVKGFLKSYANAVGLIPAEVLARYTASRRVAYVTPIPVQTPLSAANERNGRRFGVAIAFVLLLILFTLALSFVLKPRGHDMPLELSQTGGDAASASVLTLAV